MIAEKTGWSDEQILWRISWSKIRMMLADAPAMKKAKKNKKQILEGDELAKMLGL